jgi:murein DD-endopeptidase MepM/ murein hydrolase activator NlpD
MAYQSFFSKAALLSKRGSSPRGIALGAVLIVLISGIHPGGIFGQTHPDVLGFDANLFTYHFDRADREITPEQWLNEARRGIGLARVSWERLAAELYGEGGALEAAEGRINEWSESELETRFTEWLLKRYFGGAAGALTQRVAAEIGETNRQYLFHTDGEGRVMYDPDTGDPLVIRPGEEGRDIAIDRQEWRQQVEEAISTGVGEYKSKLAEYYPELLAYIPGERRAGFEQKLEETALAASLMIQREFEGLAAREERLFIARRMGDVFSLRRKSDDEAASMISARLISETEAFCAEGIADLEERIEAAEGGGGDLALAGTEWLAAYREQFERGLKAWEDAEERFFVRRIEWEQEAGKQYAEGEETWSAAFARFEQERRNWEAKSKALFESGERLFQRASENLEKAIAAAKAEFELDAKIRTETGAERAKAWVDMYITSGSVVTGAQESVDFWLERYGGENPPPLGSDELTEWLDSRQRDDWLEIQKKHEKNFSFLEKILLGLVKMAGDDDSGTEEGDPAGEEPDPETLAFLGEKFVLWFDLKKIIAGETDQEFRAAVIEKIRETDLYYGSSLQIGDEIRQWSMLYRTYMAKALESRDALIRDFGMVIGTGGLTDVLAPGAASEDFNLDEYQIELIRARAVAGYWAKRVSIAEAVLAYAEEISAGRITDGEGVKAWEAAKQAYDNAVIRYEEEQNRLSAAGDGIEAGRESLKEAAEALQSANDKLEALNQAYTVLMAAYSENSSAFMLEELASTYRELLKEQDLLNAAGIDGVYMRYLERARELGFALEVEGAGELLQRLVAGDDGEKSLAALGEAAAGIMVPPDNGVPPDAIEAYGLEPDDPYYNLLKQLLDERKEKIAAAGDSTEKSAVEARYGKLIVTMARAAKARAEGLLENRLQGLNMLLEDSAGDWYFSARAAESSQADLDALQAGGLEERLRSDADLAMRALLQARLELELEGLNYILNGGSAGEDAVFLSQFYTAGPGETAEFIHALQYLKEIMQEHIHRDTAAYRDALERAAGENGLLRWFIQGGSFLHAEGGAKITEGFLAAYTAAAERGTGLLELYQTYGWQTPMAVREKWEQNLRGLRQVFSSYGIEINETYLPGITAMGTAVLNRPGKPVENLAAFLYQLDERLDPLPEWLNTEFDAWKTAFTEYMAARLVYLEDLSGLPGSTASAAGPGKSLQEIQEKERALQAQMQGVQKVYDALSVSAPGSARALCAALELNTGGFVLLNRDLLEAGAVRRIGEELALLYGAMDIPDEAALRAALLDGAARYHDYAGETIRQRAVEEALGILRLSYAVDTRGSADELEGAAKKIRLNQLFFEMGAGGAAPNTAAARIGELAAALADPAAGGLEPLLAFTRAYVGELRTVYGEASLIAERMLGAALALTADTFLSFKTIPEELGLNFGEAPEAFYEKVRGNEFNVPAGILQFKGPLAGEGILFYLKQLLYGGDGETYQRELEAYRLFLAAAYRDDPGGLAEQEGYLREAESFADLLKAGRSYLGSALSGEPVEWALRQRAAGIPAGIDVLNGIITGIWDDPFITALTWPGKPAGVQDAYDEILQYELNAAYLELFQSDKRLAYEYALVEDYEKIRELINGAEQEGENHWRQYIAGDFLDDYNRDKEGEDEKLPAGISGAPEEDYHIIKGALNQREGFLADALAQGERKRQLLNDAFALYNGQALSQAGPFADLDAFRARVAGYRDDTGLDWDGSAVIFAAYRYYDNYYLEAEELQKHIAREEYLRQEISRLGMGYEIIKKGQTAILAEKERKLSEIARQQEEYVKASETYSERAEIFLALGEHYDRIYGEAKKRYEALEDARFRYETQDAIRRWASTAYLDAGNQAGQGSASGAQPYQAPHDDLVYSKERWERAKMVLTVLTGLYDDGETRRPYEDAAYEELYQAYEESFGRMILSIKALDSIDAMIRQETQKNEAYYQSYHAYLTEWGKPIGIGGGYTSPEDRGEWEIKDVISVQDGKLAFSRDLFFSLQGISGEVADARASALEEYFKEDKTLGTETNKASLFEEALRGLSERMTAYAFDSQKYKQWGLARDFLMQQLILRNPGLDFLSSLYEKAKALERGQNLGEMPIRERYYGFKSEKLVYESAGDFNRTLAEMQSEAWMALSPQEREDLEFYTILTLFGGGGKNSSAFSQISELEVFRHVLQDATDRYNYLNSKSKKKLIGWFYRPDRDMLAETVNHIKPSFDLLSRNVSRGLAGMRTLTGNLNKAYGAYKKSSDYIAVLLGSQEEGEGVVWDDLLWALTEAGDLSEDEIEKLESYWVSMNRDAEGIYKNNIEALRSLVQWSKNTKEDIREHFERAWAEDEELRQKEELRYRELADAYVSGGGSLENPKAAAMAAFGREAAAGKNHLENLERVIMNDLSGIMENGSGFRMEYIGLAGEYTGLITRAYAMRYNAELSAREAEWNQQRRDVQEKYRDWQQTAALILERGREDWKSGTVKLQDAYDQWVKKYQEEYLRVNNLWNASYLAGLEDKETWIARATAAANDASSGAMLAMVGADAEVMARAMDTRLPADTTGLGGTDEAQHALAELLESAGIVNLMNAFNGINGTAGTVASHLKRGIGGPGVWNTGTIQTAAAAFAKETNGILADREAKKVAANVREIAEEAVRSLDESVDKANRGFRENMDAMFVVEGQWKRNGRNYIKDVIVHSTLFDPVITEQVAVAGYEDYRPDPVLLKTDLNENRLKDLDFFAVQALIDNMYKEVSLISEEIFGSAEENSREGEKARTVTIDEYAEKKRYVLQTVTVTDENGNRIEQQVSVPESYTELVKSEERTTGAGKFGAHIGYHPVMKTGISAGQKKHEIFVDPGTGQLGKLMTEYLYWTIQEGSGINAMSMAVWDKPMWDSRDSWFNAPSVRGVVDLSHKIAAVVVGAVLTPFTGGASMVGAIALTAAISTAINMSDDLVFGALDVGGGYKDFDEAGFEFGKKTLITAASSVASSAFSGLGSAAGSAASSAAGRASGSAWGAGAGGGTSALVNGGINGAVTNGLTGASRVIAQTAMTGVQTITTNTVTNALNAFTYDRENGFGWSKNVFAQGMRGGLVNALVDMTGTFTGGALGQINLFDGNDNALSGKIVNRANIGKFNNFAGGLAEQGMGYALGQDFTLNLLNANLLTGGRANTGLLELRFGHDGTNMEFGAGGADVSPGAIMAAMDGLQDTVKIGGAKLASLFGNLEPVSTLNAVNMLGYTGNTLNEALGRSIWEDRIKAVYGTPGTDEWGNEIMGMYNQESPDEIGLSELLLGKGNEKAAMLAAAMAHEGIHLTGNRYEYAAYQQGLGTYANLISQFNLEGDAGVLNMMINELYNPASYRANTGNTDYWKLMRDGSLVNDNQGYLRDENGFYVSRDGSRTVSINPEDTIGAAGIETGLLNILYGGTSGVAYANFSDWQIALAQELLRSSGFVHNGAEAMKDRYWNTGNDDKSISFDDITDVFGNTVAAQVFMNGMDKLSDDAVFGSVIDRIAARSSIPDYMLGRFDQLAYAKSAFYTGTKTLFQTTEDLSISQYFSRSTFYAGDQHRGVDVRGAPGTLIQSGYDGKVIRNYQSASAGNSLVVEYGFNFEDSFYSTGIQAQFMHLKNPSNLAENTWLDGTTAVGLMGNTGLVVPEPTALNPDAGTHLHYQLMGNLPGYGAEDKAWAVLESRRNRFLDQIGAPGASKYAANQGTFFLNNYTGMGYNNYFYNANNFLLGMGL